MAFVHNLPQLRLQSVTFREHDTRLTFSVWKGEAEDGRKRKAKEVYSFGWSVWSWFFFIGEIFRLLLRYSYLCKIAGDYFRKRKVVSICQEWSELWKGMRVLFMFLRIRIAHRNWRGRVNKKYLFLHSFWKCFDCKEL